MAYGSIKVDNVIYTKGGVDTTITVSGIVDSLSGAISVTGAISGASVSAATGTFTTLSGNTTAGTTATFTSGVFTTFSGTTVNVVSGVFASGTVAAPSVSVGTSGNGLYSPGANQLAISTSGTGRLTVDNSGNVNIDSGTLYVDAVNNRVGVGTLLPASPLDVNGVISVAGLSGIRSRTYGYGAPYIAIEIGTPSSNTGTVALGVNVNSIAGGGFSGQNQVIIPANGLLFPNAAGTDFVGALARDSSNRLLLGPGTSGGITSGQVVIDDSGNLGLGVVPSAWSAGFYKAIEGGDSNNQGAVAFRTDTNGVELYANGFFNGSNNVYKYNGAAGLYQNTAGTHTWYTAPSGTAGNAITFTQAMTLDASGNLGLGVVPSAWDTIFKAQQIGIGGFIAGRTNLIMQVHVGANAYYDATDSRWEYIGAGEASRYFQSDGAHAWEIAGPGTANAAITFTQAMTLDASGRLLVGTTSDSGGALLQVNGDRIRVATAKTPASATAAGTAGEVCWDTNYIYVCTATNTWKRAAIATW